MIDRDHKLPLAAPEIFNTDQGSQFTSDAFTGLLKASEIQISMDGKGSWKDNVFVERLWKSVKYEEVYLRAYESVPEARTGLGRYFEFYNAGRPHSSLGGMTPDQFFDRAPAAFRSYRYGDLLAHQNILDPTAIFRVPRDDPEINADDRHSGTSVDSCFQRVHSVESASIWGHCQCRITYWSQAGTVLPEAIRKAIWTWSTPTRGKVVRRKCRHEVVALDIEAIYVRLSDKVDNFAAVGHRPGPIGQELKSMSIKHPRPRQPAFRVREANGEPATIGRYRDRVATQQRLTASYGLNVSDIPGRRIEDT